MTQENSKVVELTVSSIKEININYRHAAAVEERMAVFLKKKKKIALNIPPITASRLLCK